MAFLISNNKTRGLILLFGILIVVGGFIWDNYNLSQGAFEKIKSIISDLSLLRATTTVNIDLYENLGTDLSETKIEELFSQAPIEVEAPEQTTGSELEQITEQITAPEEEEQEEPELIVAPRLSLAEIKVKLDEIEQKTQEIEKEIKKLEDLIKIQKEINEIVKEVQKLSQEIKKSA